MKKTPKYRVGDLVEFYSRSSDEKHTGRIVIVHEWSGGDIRYDIKSDVDGVYYRKKEEDISYTPHPLFENPADYNKELLKRMVNDYHYGLFPGYDREAIKKHFKEAVRKQQIRETIRNDLTNLHPESEEKKMGIRVGDCVSFRYVGEFLEGTVTKICFTAGGPIYVDIDCGGGSVITCYPADNIISNSSAEMRSMGRDMKDAFRYLPNTGLLSSLKYYDETVKCNKEAKAVYTPNIKINQTEITGGDRKGLYSTVFFKYYVDDPITIKKSEDTNNDILLAIAYANAIRYCDTNSKFKKRVDTETIKMGNDYVIQLDWRNFFVPGEILKRKRWDIYTYVAVQLLFRTFSIKDIQEAIENCTYTKKEK